MNARPDHTAARRIAVIAPVVPRAAAARAAALATGLTLAALTLSACGGPELSGPPALRPGRDQCAECGMIINDARFAGAVLLDRDGRREHALFDDVGCMLDYERDGGHDPLRPDDAPPRLLDRWAGDHASGAWAPTSGAWFVFGVDERRAGTPMGSGILAFGAREGADRARADLGGEVMDYARLAEARRLWMEERYGKPRAPGESKGDAAPAGQAPQPAAPDTHAPGKDGPA